MSQLKSDLLVELAKVCIVSEEILSVIKPHLQYSFIQQEPMKHIFKYIFDFHSSTKKSPTIGMLSQNVTQKDTLELIGKIREVNVFDKKQELISEFEEFIRTSRFHEVFKKTADLNNTGKKDEAMQFMAKESAEIINFSLKRQLNPRIFADFNKHLEERRNTDYSNQKIPFGIPALDQHTHGGQDRGTGSLGIAKSGAGKTTYLVWRGYSAAFRGTSVVHFAAGDSTEREVIDAYNAAWTGANYHDIVKGELTGVDVKKIERAREAFMAQKGEIYVHVFKQFHNASIADCRNVLIDLLKDDPNIGLVIFDYLEKFEPGDKNKYGTNDDGQRAKKIAIAEKIINIGTEFNVAVATVTQASSVKEELLNDPNFVLKREHISNLKATIDAFAYAITLNQTKDENDQEIMRIHEEKLRHYKIKSWEETYHIAQDREKRRFIDIVETKKRFWNDEEKKIIRHIIKDTKIKKKEKAEVKVEEEV